MSPADEVEYAALTRAVSSTTATPALEAYKDKCLRRRIATRMRACGVHSYAEYRAELRRNPAELERLGDALTINVTRFFRNAETWRAVRETVLPALSRQRGVTLRAWSAGCSSGEEAYSIAVLVARELEAAGRESGLGGLAVDATDIDRTSLGRAREGWYGADAAADVPRELLARYFDSEAGGYRVSERVRRQVRVVRHDLSREPPPRGDYDVILCRNVAIYFDRSMQERLFDAFHDALTPGGYLVLGRVETLFGPARDRFVLLDPRERIYRRPA